MRRRLPASMALSAPKSGTRPAPTGCLAKSLRQRTASIQGAAQAHYAHQRAQKEARLACPNGETSPRPVIATFGRSGTLDMALFAIMQAMVKTKKWQACFARRRRRRQCCAPSPRSQPMPKSLEGYVDVYLGGMYGTVPKLTSIVTQQSSQTALASAKALTSSTTTRAD